jgi:thiamine biosynthesis lipoprotein
MGTRFELVLEDGTCRDLRPAGEAALEEIEEWHRRLSRFAPDSLLSHINRTAARAPVRLDGETFALFADALEVARATDGAFDIDVGGLMGEHALGRSAAQPPSRPRDPRGAWRLDAEAWTIQFAAPGVSLDLGAIGKGHALDCAAAVLREHEITRALLHGGTSSVLAIGAPARSEGWRVALGPEEGASVVTLRDSALAVSDSAGQAAVGRPAHIVDPRSGRLVERAGRVAVLGPSARLADAWATALVVLGEAPETFPPGYRAFFDPGVSA